MKEGKFVKYAKLTMYSFISKCMSECATDHNMAMVKRNFSERSKKTTVCQDQKFELMGDWIVILCVCYFILRFYFYFLLWLAAAP